MKIYRLDIDVAKPINQMVAMQQNTTGMLVVTVTKDGGYLRNATCSVYDGENEITPYHIEDNHFWFKVDVGIQKKNLTIKASATPLTSTEKYVIKMGTSGPQAVLLPKVQLPTGTYRQDEFLSLVSRFGNTVTNLDYLIVQQADKTKINIDQIIITPKNPIQQLWFVKMVDGVKVDLPQDELIVATDDVQLAKQVTIKTRGGGGVQYGEEDYPSVGYYADYSLDAVIVPSKNADCFGEGDFPEPDEPVDSSDSELDSTDTGLDSTDTQLDSNDSELTGD